MTTYTVVYLEPVPADVEQIVRTCLPPELELRVRREAEPVAEGEVLYRPGMTMADVERATIEAALRETKGNRRKAAEILGIGERTLYRKLKEYALA